MNIMDEESYLAERDEADRHFITGRFYVDVDDALEGRLSESNWFKTDEEFTDWVLENTDLGSAISYGTNVDGSPGIDAVTNYEDHVRDIADMLLEEFEPERTQRPV